MSASQTLSSRYEAGFCVFMAALAFLGRDNPSLEYPVILYLFGLLMILNLSAGIALRRLPDAPIVATGFILANCGAITAILDYSGGAASNLWVLYLLPIFTVCMLLGPRETVGVTLGVVAFNAVFTLRESHGNRSVAAFEILLKSGLFVFTALVASRLVAKDRRTYAELQSESRRAEHLTTRLEGAAALSNVALVSAGVAHDLRNAFMVISGFTDSILGDESLSQAARDALERVQRMAKLGGEMSNQLARQGADAKFELAPDDLDAIARSVTSLVQNAFLEKNARLVAAPADGPCAVRASRAHLQRLFLNLFLNALSVSKSGGQVRLTTRREDGFAVATVEDEGPGFAPELLPRLFGAYETTRASQGGTGLGLNLCARIAKEHGGSLTAENRDGGGARMTLRLPLAAA
ncbi:MAG: HAMP domain-containing histidine kinase [Elusimicrobia bacterium]|nr:HAMP domain-containing histidine kinase [Elusimicrobiota bacterium]